MEDTDSQVHRWEPWVIEQLRVHLDAADERVPHPEDVVVHLRCLWPQQRATVLRHWWIRHRLARLAHRHEFDLQRSPHVQGRTWRGWHRGLRQDLGWPIQGGGDARRRLLG